MKCLESCKERLENKFQLLCFYMVLELLWLTSSLFFFNGFLVFFNLHYQHCCFSFSHLTYHYSPANFPVTTTYCGKLRLFLTLRGNISMAILMEPHLLHLGLSLLQLMMPFKLFEIQSFSTGICKIK